MHFVADTELTEFASHVDSWITVWWKINAMALNLIL